METHVFVVCALPDGGVNCHCRSGRANCLHACPHAFLRRLPPNVVFATLNFVILDLQVLKPFKSSIAGIIRICTGAHVRLHGSSACTLLVVLLPSQRLNTAVFIMKRSFSISVCLFLVFALAQATGVCICALLAVHAHAHAHICYEA